MATSSAKEIYEQHIKPTPLAERLRLVEMIAHEIVTAAEEKSPSKRSILELEGLGANLWEGIEAQEYVNDLRKE